MTDLYFLSILVELYLMEKWFEHEDDNYDHTFIGTP